MTFPLPPPPPYCGQQSIRGGEVWRFTTNEGDCKNVTEPSCGGRAEGGIGLCEVYRETAKICVIRSEFSPMAIDTLTSRRKLNITVFKVYMYIKFIVTAKICPIRLFAHGT